MDKLHLRWLDSNQAILLINIYNYKILMDSHLLINFQLLYKAIFTSEVAQTMYILLLQLIFIKPSC